MQYSLNLRGKIMPIDKPLIMAIFNTSNNSFYQHYEIHNTQQIADTIGKLIDEGAHIIDIGGQSTKPGAPEISETQEIEYMLPVMETIKKHYPHIPVSVDTYKLNVAKAAINAGAEIINDISAAQWQPLILPLIAETNTVYIMMHIQNTPQNMQWNPQYENVVAEVFQFLDKKIRECTDAGIHDIIVDVGFGFGKTVMHNYELLRNLSFFKNLGKPILAGISRKSMITKVINVKATDALNGTTALHMAALMQGANILRVHDVKEAKQCIDLYLAIKDKRATAHV